MSRTGFKFTVRILLLTLAGMGVQAAEQQVTSPDGRVQITLSDTGGLRYGVAVDGKPVIDHSSLGLEFQDGTKLGPAAVIVRGESSRHDGEWENRFGQRRSVPERWNQVRVELVEGAQTATPRRFGLIVRAFDNGVAFRYELPETSGLGEFVLSRELTEFRFVKDYRCWAGGESNCAENQYPQTKLSAIPALTSDPKKVGQPFRSVLPLLVEAEGCLVAIAEADLLDWAGMFLSGKGGEPAVSVTLAPRTDGRGAVVSKAPCVSPWRVLMIGRTAAELIGSDLVATLATPNRLGDVSWIQPGIAAWDAWWTGVNPTMPEFTGLKARGDTRSHKEYIDFAAEMGFPYQIVDWFWYEDDLSKPLPHVDLPALFTHAREKGVRLFIWMHSKDLKRMGEEAAFAMVAGWGAAGVKIDFMESDSQETVQWYASTLAAAARHRLMVNFHGAYKPTGLSRTYPNLITQEGVLGNEFNKFGGKLCSPLHTVTLPFTRGLLGPMDFTPGGFLNRAPGEFKDTFPAQVIGTRARQLAMTVLYHSPLLVLCDSPANYRGEPGVEFFRGLPTVWDETVVLEAEVGKRVAMARRSGTRWYLAAMNGGEAVEFNIPLSFLGSGNWSLRSFADRPGKSATELDETSSAIDSKGLVKINLAPAGGYAAVLSRQ